MVASACIGCGVALTAKHRGCLPRRCSDCKRRSNTERQRRWRASNPERSRFWSNKPRTPEQKEQRWANDLFQRCGLTVERYDALLAEQGGMCAICGGPPNGPGSEFGRFHVDHDHKTDRVRGLLCGRCNTAIGLLDESPERFAQAVEYLSNG